MGTGGTDGTLGAVVPETSSDLQRSGWLSRFPAETELSYQNWFADRMVPLAFAVAIPSLTLWLLIPFVSRYFLGADMPASVWWISLGINAPSVVLWMVLTRTAWRRWLSLITVPGLLIIGGATMYGVRVSYDGTASAVACDAIFFAFISQFVRLPFRSTAVIGLGLIGTALAIAVRDANDGSADLAEVWPACSFLVTSLMLVLGISLIGEQELRRAYVDEQVITRQQTLLTESRRLMRRYMPQGVVDQIETGHGTEVDAPVRRRVTILFSDVVGFTELADRLDPESLTQVVNEYLAAVAEIIEQDGGTLNEFAGDGFMAVFGAPQELEPEEQVRAALAAATHIHARLPELNEGWARLGVDRPVQTRIGINTGVLSVGTFGSAGRATYTAIGLQTNIAARIQAQCEPGSTLLSQTSWQLVKNEIECDPMGEVSVKGVHFPIALYRPRP